MNLGDEAILAGQLQELKKIPGITITVVGRFPQEIKRLHKVNAVSLYQFGKIRKHIKRSDIIIVGGGGLINKIERGYKGFLYQLYMLLSFFYLPMFYRRKVYVLGIGIYANANAFIVNLVLPVLRYATLITVRDHHSYEFLKKKHIRVSLYKDNSFLMDLLPKQALLDDPFIKEHFMVKKRNIGISLVKPEIKADEEHLLKEVAKFVVANNANTDFWFYPADTNPSYTGDDLLAKELLEETRKISPDAISLHMVPKSYTPQFFFSTIKLMNGFIAMRFHAAMFAYRSGIPFAGIAYDTKVASFVEATGRKPLYFKRFNEQELEKTVL